MPSPELLLVVCLTFVGAGFVKGVVGLGLPTIALAVLTATLGLGNAMALMLLPSLITNVWQACSGGAFGVILRRLWPLLLAGCAGIAIGGQVLAGADQDLLAGLLGLLLCLYCTFSLIAPELRVPEAAEPWLSPAIGATTGFFTGLTGSFVVPAVPYFEALKLPREVLIQTIGIWVTTITVALGVMLAGHGLLAAELGISSAIGVVPALIGMALGQRLRRRVPEAAFRRLFLTALLLLGAYIVYRAWG